MLEVTRAYGIRAPWATFDLDMPYCERNMGFVRGLEALGEEGLSQGVVMTSVRRVGDLHVVRVRGALADAARGRSCVEVVRGRVPTGSTLPSGISGFMRQGDAYVLVQDGRTWQDGGRAAIVGAAGTLGLPGTVVGEAGDYDPSIDSDSLREARARLDERLSPPVVSLSVGDVRAWMEDALRRDVSHEEVMWAVEGLGESLEGVVRERLSSGIPRWEPCGTCEWAVDLDGTLMIRPSDGLEGTLADWAPDEGWMVDATPPWHGRREEIEAVRLVGAVRATTCLNMFVGCSRLRDVDLSGLDTSRVTDMSGMFAGCGSLVSLDLSGLDTSRVECISGMFCDCASLETLILTGLDTSRVADMAETFACCTSLHTLLSDFDTSAALSMSAMFMGCESLAMLDLSGWDTRGVTDMGGMFMGCSNLRRLDLSGWDVSNVTATSGMFDGCCELAVVADGPCVEAVRSADVTNATRVSKRAESSGRRPGR